MRDSERRSVGALSCEYKTGDTKALKPKSKPTREQEIAEEVVCLRAKVAYLEKLRVLRASKSRSAVARRLAAQGHRLGRLLKISESARYTYFYHLSRPERVTRSALEPLVRAIWESTANKCGHWQVGMRLVHEFGQDALAKSVIGVMRHMCLRSYIRSRNPWRRDTTRTTRTARCRTYSNATSKRINYSRSSAPTSSSSRLPDSRCTSRPYTTWTARRNIAWDASRYPVMAQQQKRLLTMLWGGVGPAHRHGAVPAPMVEEEARTPRYPIVRETQGQLPVQYSDRIGFRTSKR